VLRFEDLTLNPQTREVHRGARAIELTKIEFDLLELFLHHPRQVLTRDQILDLVWGYNFDSGTNSWPSTSATCAASSKRTASPTDPDGARRGLRASHHVTFRSRVIAATVAAAAIAVILACFASFFTTRNALIHSVDESLLQASSPPDHLGDDAPYGRVLLRARPAQRRDDALVERAHRRDDHDRRPGQEWRRSPHRPPSATPVLPRTDRPLPADSLVGCSTNPGLCEDPTTSAELFVVDITGQVNELQHLIAP
jgi:hypothetical protein